MTFIVIVVIAAIFQTSFVSCDKSDLIEAQDIINGCHLRIERIILIEMNEANQRMLWCGEAEGLMAFRYGYKTDQFIVFAFHVINVKNL